MLRKCERPPPGGGRTAFASPSHAPSLTFDLRHHHCTSGAIIGEFAALPGLLGPRPADVEAGEVTGAAPAAGVTIAMSHLDRA